MTGMVWREHDHHYRDGSTRTPKTWTGLLLEMFAARQRNGTTSADLPEPLPPLHLLRAQPV